MRASVIVFPGSNCDRDVMHALSDTLGIGVDAVWHGSSQLLDTDLVVLPGGFSFGDYLRCGAMSARSPIMDAVKDHAERGGLVLGICNGFQVLTEARMLEGALLANECTSFICSPCYVKVIRDDTPFTSAYDRGQVVQYPIAHHEGLFYMPHDELAALEKRGGVVFRYCSPDGEDGAQYAPNGSLNAIAGIINERGNVMGLMPHPERASEEILGGTDGRAMWHSVRVWADMKGK